MNDNTFDKYGIMKAFDRFIDTLEQMEKFNIPIIQSVLIDRLKSFNDGINNLLEEIKP